MRRGFNGNYNLRKKSSTLAMYDKRKRKQNNKTSKPDVSKKKESRSDKILQMWRSRREDPESQTSETHDENNTQQETPATSTSAVVIDATDTDDMDIPDHEESSAELEKPSAPEFTPHSPHSPCNEEITDAADNSTVKESEKEIIISVNVPDHEESSAELEKPSAPEFTPHSPHSPCNEEITDAADNSTLKESETEIIISVNVPDHEESSAELEKPSAPEFTPHSPHSSCNEESTDAADNSTIKESETEIIISVNVPDHEESSAELEKPSAAEFTPHSPCNEEITDAADNSTLKRSETESFFLIDIESSCQNESLENNNRTAPDATTSNVEKQDQKDKRVAKISSSVTDPKKTQNGLISCESSTSYSRDEVIEAEDALATFEANCLPELTVTDTREIKNSSNKDIRVSNVDKSEFGKSLLKNNSLSHRDRQIQLYGKLLIDKPSCLSGNELNFSITEATCLPSANVQQHNERAESSSNSSITTMSQNIITIAESAVETIFVSDHVRTVLRNFGVASAMVGMVETLTRTARAIDRESASANMETCLAAGISDQITLHAVSTELTQQDSIMKPLIYEEEIVDFDEDLMNNIWQQTENFPADTEVSLDSNPPSCVMSSVDSEVLLTLPPESCREQVSTCSKVGCTSISHSHCSLQSSPAKVQRGESDSCEEDNLNDSDYRTPSSASSDSEDSTSDDEFRSTESPQPTPTVPVPSTSREPEQETRSEPIPKTSKQSRKSPSAAPVPPRRSIYQGVTVSTCNIDPDKKSYKRMNWCYYCEKQNSHIARHLKFVHSNEPAVAEILAKEASIPKNQHYSLYEKLRKEGDSKHNQSVLRSGSGVLRPTRRKREVTNAEEYVICVHCKGFVYKKVLYIHLKTCKSKERNEAGDIHPRYAAGSAYVVTHSKAEVSDEFKDVILKRMQCDTVQQSVLNDPLIIRFGAFLYDNLDGINTRNQQTRNNMREAGRLLMAVQQLDSTVSRLEMVFNVKKWDVLVKAVLAVTKMEVGISNVATPSLAIKIGYHLQKMGDILLGDALRNSDDSFEKQIRSFMKLRDIQWTSLVVKRARRNLQRKKLNRKDLIPLTEDLKIMSSYIKQKIEFTQEKFKNGTATSADWTYFSRLLLVKCVMFNFKRVGEVSNFELSEYAMKTKGDLRSDVASGLTKSEQFMATHMTRVETVGKCTKNVPLLLTEEMVTWIDKLISTRRSVGNVSDKNIYVFANPQAYTKGYINGYDSFRQLARDSGAKQHELIRSTKLRHHVATSSQILDLNHYELEQLATFMGHTLDVHRNYYRLPDSTIQVAKISLLLHAMDKNDMSKFTGKSLDEIDIDDLLVNTDSDVEDDDDADNNFDDRCVEAENMECDDISLEPEATASTSTSELTMSTQPLNKRKCATPNYSELDEGAPSSKRRATTPAVVDHQPDSTSIKEPVTHTRVKRGRENYVYWSKEELDAIQRGFATNFATLVRPKKPEIDAFMKKEAAAMSRRSFKNVRDHVQTKITSLKSKQY